MADHNQHDSPTPITFRSMDEERCISCSIPHISGICHVYGIVGLLSVIIGEKEGQDHILAGVRREGLVLVLFWVRSIHTSYYNIGKIISHTTCDVKLVVSFFLLVAVK